MRFRVYQCQNAFDLCKRAHSEGFKELWMPVRRVKTLRRPVGKSPYYAVTEQAAVTRYLYVPVSFDPEFRAWCPKKYDPRPLHQYVGEAGITKDKHLTARRPVEVGLNELLEHEAAIRNAESPVARGEAVSLVIGDEVEFEIAGYLVQGILANFNRGQSVRVRIGSQYVNVKLNKLNKV